MYNKITEKYLEPLGMAHNPEERISRLLCDGSLKSRKSWLWWCVLFFRL